MEGGTEYGEASAENTVKDFVIIQMLRQERKNNETRHDCCA